MINIKTKLKIIKIKKQIKKTYYFLMKPLAFVVRKIDDYSYNRKSKKMKLIVSQLTDEDVVKLIIKDIIKELIRYPSYSISFAYEKRPYGDFDSILDYIRKSNNKILMAWRWERFHGDEERNQKLLSLLKKELLNYPEIEFYDYQKDKYYPKILGIELKGDE